MERTEIIDFLRENLTVEVEMNDNYECESRYVSCNVTLRLGDEVLSDDYDSVRISE